MSDIELNSLIDRLALVVKQLDPTVLERVLLNQASLDVVVKPIHKQAAITHLKIESTFNQMASEVEANLNASESRDEAREMLQSLSKLELQFIAKRISLSIDSGANKEKIIEKIVERKVGLRLRQTAFSEVMCAA